MKTFLLLPRTHERRIPNGINGSQPRSRYSDDVGLLRIDGQEIPLAKILGKPAKAGLE